MSNTKYIFNGESLELTPTVKEPSLPITFDQSAEAGLMYRYKKNLADYNAHLAECKANSIPVSEELKAMLKVGQEVEEDVDFQIKNIPSCGDDYCCESACWKRKAIPIPKPAPASPADWEADLKAAYFEFADRGLWVMAGFTKGAEWAKGYFANLLAEKEAQRLHALEQYVKVAQENTALKQRVAELEIKIKQTTQS